MTQTISLEQLQKQNRELKDALEERAAVAHYALRDDGRFYHRGSFHNCPAPECVNVRVLLGKDEAQS